jgi:hypothetical protein
MNLLLGKQRLQTKHQLVLLLHAHLQIQKLLRHLQVCEKGKK